MYVDLVRVILAVGVLSLFIEVGAEAWDAWGQTQWRGLRVATPIWHMLLGWAMYMAMFLLGLLSLDRLSKLVCSICS